MNSSSSATTLNAFKLQSALMAELNIHEGTRALDDCSFTRILSFTTICLYHFHARVSKFALATLIFAGYSVKSVVFKKICRYVYPSLSLKKLVTVLLTPRFQL